MPDEQVLTQELETVDAPPVETTEEVETTEGEQPVVPAKPEPTEIEKKLQAAEREAERHRKRADYWMENYQKTVQPPAATATTVTDPEPQEAEFGDNTLGYAKAYAAWAARDAIRQENTKRQTESREQVAQTQKEVFVQERNERINEAAQRDPAVWTACDTLGKMGVVIGTPLQDALHESENFDGLVKHLAANPQEVQRILSLPPVRQVKEIARLEVTISTPAAPPPPPLRTTAAPPPAKPLSGSSTSTAAIDLNDPNLPMDVWQREHSRQEKAKLKRLL